jgi:site-specific DNA-methyltransferase (adenine-specific)
VIDPATITHEVRCADCLGPDGLATLPDKSVDHVICDPPYEAEAHTLQRRVKRGGGVMEVEPLSFSAMTEEGRDAVAREIARVVRRWVVAFCQVEAALKWAHSMEAAGLVYKRTGVWVKPDGMPQYSGDRPGMGYESIVVAHAPGRSTWNGGGKHGVWTFPKMGSDDRERTGHETQKPLALMQALVRDFTDPGDLILDAFAGSGTTGVAAKRLGRRFLGWERDPKYHAIAEKRIASAKEQRQLFAERGPEPVQVPLIGGSR